MFASMILIGPRFAILVWWLFDQDRWNLAFDNFLFAFIGFFLAPWTTLMYVAVFTGGVTGFDWIIIGLGIFADVTSWTSGGMGTSRYQRYSAA